MNTYLISTPADDSMSRRIRDTTVLAAAVAFDPTGELYLTDAQDRTVAVFARGEWCSIRAITPGTSAMALLDVDPATWAAGELTDVQAREQHDGEPAPAGWWITARTEDGDAAVQIHLEFAVDTAGGDQRGPLAARIAQLLGADR